mmetsp:Transcript_25719/g.55904  ORF Transcript_25719/g.55904 Transcript_25719/m.55904 type:complete len:322 (+) Transcript_25719:369-1334(+)|eukprot:CAMPEP_0206484492 /NCGR_PEP_ID=MMETSP0324_2-20121206/40008_1 /ASSEMBLY_ACC=CAM_ASM_000836 /TAXON_ID=2866 /ORGANISM="Crypthecodinium cohnii, Strain Seligo" /LENGTH=321 /DNA_ID=CAMNT_0053962653 /DNA_START=348 /DNA_END=1313 /DNA_ORIENTATION=-
MASPGVVLPIPSAPSAPLPARPGGDNIAHGPGQPLSAASAPTVLNRSRYPPNNGELRSRGITEHGKDVVCAIYLTVMGMGAFAIRPHLWVKVILPILVTLATTIASLVILFSIALGPQAHLFIKLSWPDWLAWTVAVLCVLVEVSVVNLIVLLVLFGQVQSDILRSILEEKGVIAALRDEKGEVPEQNCMRDVCHSIGFLLVRLPLLLLTLPLNAIPVLGQVAWILLNGWLYAWELEAEFMVMLDNRFSCDHQLKFVKNHFGAFFTFGAGAMALELIPFVGPWVFFATNACGAALLAERFHEERKRRLESERDLEDESSSS